MTRYRAESLRDAIALPTALVAGDEETFARLVEECVEDRAESTIAVLAYVLSKMASTVARLSHDDLTAEQQAALTDGDLRERVLEVLSLYGTSFARQLEDEGRGE
jgi:hypothetical protein